MHEVFEEESQKSQKPRLLASIATAAGEWLLKQGYDIPVLCKVNFLFIFKLIIYSVFIFFIETKVVRHDKCYDLCKKY